jgi:hypothetical protein
MDRTIPEPPAKPVWLNRGHVGNVQISIPTKDSHFHFSWLLQRKDKRTKIFLAALYLWGDGPGQGLKFKVLDIFRIPSHRPLTSTCYYIQPTFNSKTAKIHGWDLLKIINQLIVFFTHSQRLLRDMRRSEAEIRSDNYDTCSGAPKQESTRERLYLWTLMTISSRSIYHSIPNLLLLSVLMIQWKMPSLSHSFDQTPPQFSTQVLPRSKDNGVQQKHEVKEDFTKKSL